MTGKATLLIAIALAVSGQGTDVKPKSDNSVEIRRSVQEYIFANYTDETERRALMQDAKAMHQIFTVDLNDKDRVKEVNIKNSRSTSCIHYVFHKDHAIPAAKVSTQLEKRVFNTDSRRKRMMAFSKASSGMTWATPKPSPSMCD